MSTNGRNGGTMRMQLKAMTVASLGIVGMLGLSSTVACSKIAAVQAMMAYKQANQAYTHQDYKRAASLYEETVQANPEMAQVYFYLGNSYDNQFKPGASDPANIELLNKAVQNYQLAAEKLTADTPADVKVRALALQYLVAAYGPDKLNDPVKAEPIVQRLIQLDPSEPANYFALAKLYEDAGAYKEAEEMLNYAKQAKPTDPAVYVTLAGYYSRQGQVDKTIQLLEERAQKEPNNPEAFYTIATYYWDAAYRDATVQEKDKKLYVQNGIAAIDHAIQIRPDYMEALVYKGLLLRLQANMEKEPAKQQALIKEADALREKAEEIKKRKAEGLGD